MLEVVSISASSAGGNRGSGGWEGSSLVVVVDADVIWASRSWVETADVKEVIEESEDERERVREGVSVSVGSGGGCCGGFMRSGRVLVPVDLKV